MSNLEANKIFSAILIAGITAMLSGFIANKLIHPHELEEDAVFVEGTAVAAGAVEKAQFPEPILHLIAAADIDKGQKLSKACAACHSFEKGGPNKIGPRLWDVVLAPKGHISDFAYSDALKEMGGAWSYENLNHFLWKPKQYMPGTKMNYIGLKKPEDRAALIAWLRQEVADSPAPLPNEAEIAAEKAKFAPPEEEAEAQDAEAGEEAAADADADTGTGTTDTAAEPENSEEAAE